MNNLKIYESKGKKTPRNPQIETHRYTTPTKCQQFNKSQQHSQENHPYPPTRKHRNVRSHLISIFSF